MSDTERSASKQGDHEELIIEQDEIYTKMKKFMENYRKDGPARKTLPNLEKRVFNIQNYWDEFRANDKALSRLKTQKIMKLDYFTKDRYTEVEEFYISSISEIEALKISKFSETQSNSQSTISNPDIRNRPNGGIQKAEIKLPKIELPKFSGNYSEWPGYHDLFRSLVHNSRLSNVEKLHYLQSSLCGEALKLVGHFQKTDANYEAAWSALIGRYDNKRVLVNTYLKKLLSIPSLTLDTAENNRRLIDDTDECIQELIKLKIDTSNWDPILVHVIVRKLHPDTHTLWEQSLKNQTELPTFSELKEFLESRFRTLEAIGTKKFTRPYQFRESQSQSKMYQSYATIIESTCVICSGAHVTRKCPKIINANVKARLDLVRRKGLCGNCLGHRHKASDCSSTTGCLKCGRRHHTLLHYANFSKSESAENTKSKQQQNHSDKPSNLDKKEDKVASFACHGTRNQVLLATALVNVETSTGLHTLRVLLDQGSQANFITDSAVQRLQLKRERTNTIVSGIGGVEAGKALDAVSLTLQSRTNKTIIQIEKAFVLKSLTDFLPSTEPDNSSWSHLQGYH